MDTIMKTLKVNDITTLSHEVLMEAYRNGYKLEELNNEFSKENILEGIVKYNRILSNNSASSKKFVSSLSCIVSCPISVTQGSRYQITVQVLEGTPPYKFEFYVDDAIINSWTDTFAVQTWYNTFNDAVGSHVYKIVITDSESNVKEDSCTVNVTAVQILASISVPESITIKVGQTFNIVSCIDTSGKPMICPELDWYRSTDNHIARYSDGSIQGISPGILTIAPYDTSTKLLGNVCTVTVTT